MPSLRTRLIAFLTIAMLPLGVIAVVQTIEVSREAARLAERDLLARTVRAADDQAAMMRRSIGASNALGSAAASLRDQSDTCSQIMADFVETQEAYVFAGFIQANGIMVCHSGTGPAIDYAGQPDWEAFVANPVPNIVVNREGDVSNESVYIAFTPIFEMDGTLLGGQAISIPHGLAQSLLESEAQDVDLAIVDPEGMVLASSTGMGNLRPFQRLGLVPSDMDVTRDGALLQTRTSDGLRQPAAILPLIPGRVYVVGLWTQAETAQRISLFGRFVPLFPLVMWMVGLAVAYYSVSKLVLRPLSKVQARMERYHAGETLADTELDAGDPAEIRQISDSYNDLVLRVARDQAVLEDNVREKTLLLREIHHRVKNNLQLIASLLNMQMRNVQDETARGVLRRVQDRVLSLSAIHHALYTDDQFDRVNVAESLGKIVEGVGDIALPTGAPVEVTHEVSPVWLDPDQAIPLLLLATEAMTNAAKYVGKPAEGPARIECVLEEDDAGYVRFRVENTTGANMADGRRPDGTALGSRLITAFASQLGGEVQTETGRDRYRLNLVFENQLGAPDQRV